MDFPCGCQRSSDRRPLSVRVLGALALLVASACSNDPVYFPSTPEVLTTDPSVMPTGDAGAAVAVLVLKVPIAVEDEAATAARMDLAVELGIPADQVPKARRADTDLEVEWSITSFGDKDSSVQIAVNGANEFFRYDPGMFVDPTDEEAEVPPPLFGGPTGKPVPLPAGQTITGIIREDQLYEAAQDLDGITRAGIIPEFALITHWPTDDINGGMGGVLATVPGPAVPLLIELDVYLLANVKTELRATLRVRDRSGRLRPTEQDPALLIPASLTVFTPPPPP